MWFEFAGEVWPTSDYLPIRCARGTRQTTEGEGRQARALCHVANKLAANVAVGRNHAGVHRRSDYTQSVLLGERVVISVLEDGGFTYSEDFKEFKLTKFDGTAVTIGKTRKP